MRDILIVGISGFFGSVARYSVYLWFGSRGLTSFPWATLFVNIAGCLLIGLFGALIEREIPYYRQLALIGTIGFLGAFTTFSAFGFETFHLIKNQQTALALLNIAANVVIGLFAVGVGRSLAAV